MQGDMCERIGGRRVNDMKKIDNIPEQDGSGLDLLSFLNERGLATPAMIFAAGEASGEIRRQVAAVLLKARTSNEGLLATIKQIIGEA